MNFDLQGQAKRSLTHHDPCGKMHIAKFFFSLSQTRSQCADSKRKVTLMELRFHLLSVSDLSETVAAADSEL